MTLFVLHLVNRQSIGPRCLQAMWSAACESADVSVARSSQPAWRLDAPIYLLATHSSFVHRDAEQHMRDCLDARGYSFRLSRSN